MVLFTFVSFLGMICDWAIGFCLFLLSLGFGGALDLAAVLDFVDSGHDLIIAADSSSSDLIKSVATECGVDFDEVVVEFMMHGLFFSFHFIY